MNLHLLQFQIWIRHWQLIEAVEIRYYLCVQTLDGLKQRYEHVEAMLANCGNTLFLGSTERELLERISTQCGTTYITPTGAEELLCSPSRTDDIKKAWDYKEALYLNLPDAIRYCTTLPSIEAYDMGNYPAQFKKYRRQDSPGQARRLYGPVGIGQVVPAFDTIYAEGQRRYVESLSAYARQFLGQMDKPDVDYIEGLSPAISIDQKTTSRNPRSTVGTVTEIYDYLRLLYARVGDAFCPHCGKPIRQQTIEQMADAVMALGEGEKVMIMGLSSTAARGPIKSSWPGSLKTAIPGSASTAKSTSCPTTSP